jgi:hypothetical protein
MDMTSAKVTSDGWFVGDVQAEPRKCRCCGKGWVTREIVCKACKPIYKYRRADYYFLRSVEIQTLDMGVQVWL